MALPWQVPKLQPAFERAGITSSAKLGGGEFSAATGEAQFTIAATAKQAKIAQRRKVNRRRRERCAKIAAWRSAGGRKGRAGRKAAGSGRTSIVSSADEKPQL
ncbi:MAG: hypothetical protein QM775_22790 [Pirellulales bacterium]